MDDPDPFTSAAPQPTPLHRAIDQATLALLTAQRVRSRLAVDEQDEELVTDITTIEAALHTLGDLLIEIRDAPQS